MGLIAKSGFCRNF